MDIFEQLDEAGSAQALPKALTDALSAMPYVDPFFAAFLGGIKLLPSDSCGVMATDCVDTIYYNPETLAAQAGIWTAETLIGVLAHECMHILRLDAELMHGLDHELSNIACDAIINRDLRVGGFSFPTLTFVDPIKWYGTQTTGNASGIASEDTLATTMRIYTALVAAKKRRGDPGLPNKLSGDIDLNAYKKAKRKAGGAKAVEDKIGDMASAAARLSKEIADQLGVKPNERAKAANGMRDKGDDSGDSDSQGGSGWSLESSMAARALERLGVPIRAPKVRLLRVAGAAVRGHLRSKSKRTRSMLSPSHMSAAYGRLMPGKRRARDYRIAIAIDASGSISNEQLRLFTTAAHQWAQQFVSRGREIQVCYWSSHVCGSGPMSKFVDESNIPNAGGGTNFACVMAWMDSLPERPTHLICFTDLCFTHPTALNGNTRTIWIVPPGYERISTNFGERVILDA